jgi:hypothetical protein
MEKETRKRVIDSLRCLYETIAYDMWGDRTPDDYEEVMDVLVDLIRDHITYCEQCDMTSADYAEFQQMKNEEVNKWAREIV